MFGQVIGSVVQKDTTALTVLLQFLTIYYLGAGMLVSAKDANWLG